MLYKMENGVKMPMTPEEEVEYLADQGLHANTYDKKERDRKIRERVDDKVRKMAIEEMKKNREIPDDYEELPMSPENGKLK